MSELGPTGEPIQPGSHAESSAAMVTPPAQAPVQSAPAVSVVPAPAAPAPAATPTTQQQYPPMSQQDIATYEQRISYFQSLADKNKAEAEAKAREAEAAQREAESLRSSHQAILQGTQEAAKSALDRVAAVEEQLQRANAERLKAEALMQHPELRAYAAFIPATTDAAALNAQIEAFKTAREKDLEQLRTQQPQHNAPPASQDPASQYPPNTYIPPASPARPNPNAGSMATGQGAPADQIQRLLKNAMEESLAKRDDSIYLRAQQEAIRIANQAAQNGQ